MTKTKDEAEASGELVRALVSFTTGPTVIVKKGDVFQKGDPVTKGREAAFEAYTPDVRTTEEGQHIRTTEAPPAERNTANPSVAPPPGKPALNPGVERPRGNGSKTAWAEYVFSLDDSKSVAELEEASRESLIEIADLLDGTADADD